MAERPRGMGRGLAAILSPTIPPEGSEAPPELRRLPVELIAPNPRQPRQSFDEESLLALAGLRARARPPATRARPPPRRRHLRADRRRAPLARRPARGAGHRPGRRPGPRGRRVPGARAHREHGPRGPQPRRGGPRLRPARRGARPHPRGRRPPRRPLPRRRLQPPAPARPPGRDPRAARHGRLTEGHGRALLTAPDHGDRRRLGRQAADEGWTVRQTEARCRATTTPPEVAPRVSPHPAPGPARGRRPPPGRPLRALGADVRVAPRRRATPSPSPSTPSRRPKPWQSALGPPSRRSSATMPVLHSGAISSVG